MRTWEMSFTWNCMQTRNGKSLLKGKITGKSDQIRIKKTGKRKIPKETEDKPWNKEKNRKILFLWNRKKSWIYIEGIMKRTTDKKKNSIWQIKMSYTVKDCRKTIIWIFAALNDIVPYKWTLNCVENMFLVSTPKGG